MEWLLQHLELVVPLALVLLYVFNQVLSQREEKTRQGEDPGSEEARRIQEEIRRKIIERQQGGGPAETPGETPPPIRREAVFPSSSQRREGSRDGRSEGRRQETFPASRPESPPPLSKGRQSPRPQAAATTSSRRDYGEELRIQRQRLEEARRAREMALRQTGAVGTAPSPGGRKSSAGTALTGDFRADLGTVENLRRAFVLKEILDRPVALREQPVGMTDWT